jgi:hypothetical protein
VEVVGRKSQYSYSKRQRELRRKKKAEEKRERKQAKKEGEEPEVDDAAVIDLEDKYLGIEPAPEEAGADEEE